MQGSRRYEYLLAAMSVLAGLAVGYNIVAIVGAETLFHEAWAQSPTFIGSTLLGGAIGSFISEVLSYRWGRRAQSMTASLLALFSIVCSLWTFNFPGAVLTRLTLGLSLGVLSYQTPLYLMEMTRITGNINLNKTLLALTLFATIAGITLSYGISLWLGSGTNWRLLIALGSLPLSLLVGLWYYLPASPCWLISRQYRTEAHSILTHITLGQGDTDTWTQAEDYSQSDSFLWQDQSQLQWIGLGLLQQGFGLITVLYLAPTLLPYAGFSWTTSGMQLMVVLSSVYLVISGISFYTTQTIGPKTLMLTGALLAAGSSIVFGSSLHDSVGAIFAPWLSILTATCYVAGCSLSYGALLALLTSSQYHHNAPSQAQTIAVTIAGQWLVQATVLAGFLYLLPKVGPSISFWPLSLICVLGYAVAYHMDMEPLNTPEQTHSQPEHDMVPEQEQSHELSI